MSKKIPNIKDKALVKIWTARQLSSALRSNALEGNIEWVKLLLRETNYEAYPQMLKRDWWVRGAPTDEAHQRTKTAVSMMRRLLDSIAIADLPKEVAKQIPTSAVDKDQAMLKLWPRITIKRTR
jgi:hypothetical protein